PTRLQRKFSGKKYSAYFKAIKRIVRPGEKYVVQIVDNQGITAPLDAFLKEHHLRGQFYLQYFHHGFGPINTNARSMPIFDAIDELILLTYDSYKEYLDYYSILPLKVSVLHNGIDTA